MKPIYIFKKATIIIGPTSGISGTVVGADATNGTVEIEIEEGTYITLPREKVYQEGEDELTK